jgi:two-component system CheB/CheR fusion protein
MSLQNTNPEFEALLEYIKRSRGFDFTGYKRSSLMRRVLKRMQSVSIEGYRNYLDYLEVHPQEFIQLFNTLLINVTSFFRDRPAWDYLTEELIPLLTVYKDSYHPIRVWSAGCASGEEAYTLAIILCETLGIDQFRERVKIYATDIDEEALVQARLAVYPIKALEGISPELIAKYFDSTDQHYSFRKDLRRSLIFGRHNLTSDAPISRIDLLVCRNTLMYFNAETQTKILARFHFALNDGGFLFLGKAEMLLTHTNTFIPVDLKRRVFTKVGQVDRRDRLLTMAPNSHAEIHHLTNQVHIREAAFDNGSQAQIVIDISGFVILANEQARRVFNLTTRDLGRPLQDLEISYRPVELRSYIEQAYAERRSIDVVDIEWLTPANEIIYLDVVVVPLIERNGDLLGVTVSFINVTRSKRLQEELQQASQELEMAYEELQSTNEELETTNEELQSSNEELETTNEELQSSNEELETMNEELQSSNEELETLNNEMHRRSEELNQLNTFLEAILTSLRGAVIVLNRDMHIQIWNSMAEDLWGLRSNEVQGQHFLNLDIGLPSEQLRQIFRTCLAGESKYQEIKLDTINRRGKTLQCQITCTPLMSRDKEIGGVILVIQV